MSEPRPPVPGWYRILATLVLFAGGLLCFHGLIELVRWLAGR